MTPSDPLPPAATPEFYVAHQYRTDRSVGYLMRKVLSSVVAQADARLAEFDLTYVQWVPLYKLMMGEGNTANAMARDLSIDPAALTRALDRLQAKGLIQRDRSTSDRRVVHISLTDAGREVARHVPAVLAEVLNGHLVGFSEPEWRQMVDGLSRMLANGDRMRDAVRQPGATTAHPAPTPTDTATSTPPPAAPAKPAKPATSG